MNYRENKEQILEAIIARLKSLPAGTSKCSAGLFHECFPDEPMPESNDLFDLDNALCAQAEKNGLYLDGTLYYKVPMGLPYSIDFIVQPLKPVVSFDVVRYYESTWPSFPNELTINLRKKTVSYAVYDPGNLDHPVIHECTAPEWDEIADLIASCRFDQWEENYIEPMLDGTTWKMDLLKDGKVVKKSFGSNGYPNCLRIFTELKELCGNILKKDDTKLVCESDMTDTEEERNMFEILSFSSGAGTPGDNYRISLVPEGDAYYLRGKRSRKKSWGAKPQILRHEVKVSADWVNNLLSELQNANIPLLPPKVLGCDGDFYSLSVGTSYGGATYNWWSDPPDGWEIFPKIAQKIIAEFSKDLPK